MSVAGGEWAGEQDRGADAGAELRIKFGGGESGSLQGECVTAEGDLNAERLKKLEHDFDIFNKWDVF